MVVFIELDLKLYCLVETDCWGHGIWNVSIPDANRDSRGEPTPNYDIVKATNADAAKYVWYYSVEHVFKHELLTFLCWMK